jgi:hypothetical protein
LDATEYPQTARGVDWELVEAEAELKALQRHAFEIVDPPIK